MNNRKLHIDTHWNGFATDFQSDGKAVFFVQKTLQALHKPFLNERNSARDFQPKLLTWKRAVIIFSKIRIATGLWINYPSFKENELL